MRFLDKFFRDIRIQNINATIKDYEKHIERMVFEIQVREKEIQRAQKVLQELARELLQEKAERDI